MKALLRSGCAPRWCLIAALLIPSPGLAQEDESKLLGAMREGGTILLIRHAATESGIGDPPEFRLGDCGTQRNLSVAGRADARLLGERLRAAGIPVAEVRSSRWCRSMDTAVLAFEPDMRVLGWDALNSFFGGQGDRSNQVAEMLSRATHVPRGSNWVWVTHQVNITGLTSEFAAPGEVVVARPREGRLEVLGRWRP